jgi:hypothetical protein
VQYIEVACRALIAVVFLWSAMSKLRSRAELNAFAESLTAFLPAGSRWARPVAMAVALTELAIVPSVAVPVTATAGCALAAVLLVAFIVVIAVVVRRGQRVTCRCFGPSAAPLTRRHLVRNSLLLAAALCGAAAGGGALHPGGSALAVVGGVVAGLLLIHFDDLVDLFVSPATSRNSS